MKMAHRLAKMGNEKYAGLTKVVNGKPVWTGDVRQDGSALGIPLRVRKPTVWFVNSMSDLFHEDLAAVYIDLVFSVMKRCPQHTFQVLTKRPIKMALYTAVTDALPNVWLGTSVEDCKRKNRIDVLRTVRAAVRFLSIEPLLEDLGEVDLTGIHWVIVGGESGPKARPFDVKWARQIIAQCKAASVPCFVKQIGARPCGEWHPGSHYIRPGDPWWVGNRKGNDPTDWPADLRVREFPNVEEARR